MPPSRNRSITPREAVSFWLLAAFLMLLWIAGGASRPDVVGQVVTRTGAWGLALAIIALRLRPPSRDLRIPTLLLGLAILLPALQLVPLPPALWGSLPGRELLRPSDALSGQADVWRPLSISPGWTRNALGSLIVPAVCLALAAGVSRHHDLRLLRLLLGLIVAGCLAALVQIANPSFDHPLINDVTGQISGNFANRNHLALFIAFGCLLAPVWAVRDNALRGWSVIGAAALVMLFVLVILATGSRAGLLLAIIAIFAGLAATFTALKNSVASLPRRTTAIAAIGAFATVTAAIGASLMLGKAAGIHRAIELNAQDDVRAKVMPTVLEMLRTYFPVGSGFGTFDPAFRIFEGNELLGPSYYNQAHNDLLQVGLDGGIAGFALLLAAVVWWAARSVPAWRDGNALMGRTGSATLLLVIVASAFDYPARTPMIMAVIVLAAAWLAASEFEPAKPPPRRSRS